jgi:pentose-5-phosphate-3-epimerase
MDGVFVPNVTLSSVVVKQFRKITTIPHLENSLMAKKIPTLKFSVGVFLLKTCIRIAVLR